MEIPREQVSKYTDQSISTIHHSLRSPRRRLIVALIAHQALQAEGAEQDRTEVSVRELARAVTAIERDISLTHATGESYRSTYTSMTQTHLPALDSIRAINYDSDRKTLSPAENLLPLAMITAISSPVAQLLFHDSVAALYQGGAIDPQDSIGN